MPFGNIASFYLPITANAGASMWGTKVHKVLSAAESTSDATTTMAMGTGGAVVRTAVPYTGGTASDLDQSLYGWGIDPADMGGSAGARRYIPAGNHVATIRLNNPGVDGPSATMFMYIYKVGTAAASRARTLITSGSVTGTLTALTQTTATITVAVPEVIFDPDETIQWSFEINTSGTAVTGRTVTFYTGNQGGNLVRVTTPGLRVLADTSGAATGLTTATATTGKVLNTSGTATGLGTISGVLASTAAATGSAAGVGDALGAPSALSGTTGTTTGLGTASGAGGALLGTTGTVNIGAGGSSPVYFRPLFIFDD